MYTALVCDGSDSRQRRTKMSEEIIRLLLFIAGGIVGYLLCALLAANA